MACERGVIHSRSEYIVFAATMPIYSQWIQVVLGSIVTRCPDLPFATQSFIQLAIAYDLMRKIAPLFGERVQGSLVSNLANNALLT
jgi:hypothetical protein